MSADIRPLARAVVDALAAYDALIPLDTTPDRWTSEMSDAGQALYRAHDTYLAAGGGLPARMVHEHLVPVGRATSATPRRTNLRLSAAEGIRLNPRS